MQFELAFSSSDERLSVSLSTIADDILEQNESFTLMLSVPDNLIRPFELGSNSQAVFTIIDDDGRKC